MPRKRLFNTKKRATGSAGKSGSAADAGVSSPEAKKRRVGGSSSEEPASSASIPPYSGAEVLAEVPEERRSSPVPASALKLAIPHGCPSSSLPGASNSRALQGTHQVGMDSTNLIVNSGRFYRAVSDIGLCSACQAPLTLRNDLNSRRGLVSDLRICCTNTECNNEVKVSDPNSPEAKALNLRSTLSMRMIGKGRAGLESFCGVMDMLPPVTAHAYSSHLSVLAEASVQAAADNMRAASEYLHSLLGATPEEVVDVVVTCDGTWSKRGFTATYGIVVVIAWETGQVLDYVVKSKRCVVCARQTLDPESEEYATWWDTHRASCAKNHQGSSPSMECEGVVDLFSRSEEELHLR